MALPLPTFDASSSDPRRIDGHLADEGPDPVHLLEVAEPDPSGLVPTLELAREHLAMDAAFVCRSVGGEHVFAHVSTDDDALTAALSGDAQPRAAGAGGLLRAGMFGRTVGDIADEPRLVERPLLRELRVRALLEVPIVLADGSVYGTLGCLSRTPRPELGDRQLALLRAFADVVAQRVEVAHEVGSRARAQRRRILEVISSGQPNVVFQPIVELGSGRVAAYEALSRFAAEPTASPDRWFAAAQQVGCGPQLEVAALEVAFSALEQLPADQRLNVNVGLDALASRPVQKLLAGMDVSRVTLEVTEHDVFVGREATLGFVEGLREAGALVAIDDLGSGYAGLTRVLELDPNILKLDHQLVSGIDHDPAKLALISSTVTFADALDATVVAEGVERAEELHTLQMIGVSHAQGFYPGRPAPAPWATGTGTSAVTPRASHSAWAALADLAWGVATSERRDSVYRRRALDRELSHATATAED